jgi:hypothetical protein
METSRTSTAVRMRSARGDMSVVNGKSSTMRDQLTTRICLGEIERGQRITRRPNFLLLIADRFGWRPLPAEIPPAECALQASMSSGSSSASSRSTRTPAG